MTIVSAEPTASVTTDATRLRAPLRTAGGQLLHVAPCPYVGASARETTPEELESMTVCSWCEREVDGVGRTYFDDLRSALQFFGAYVGTESLIRAALQGVVHDSIWVPHSRSYVALGLDGGGVAWVGKTYVAPSFGELVELPGYEPHGGGGAERLVTRGDLCESRNLLRALNGTCEWCT